LGGTYNLALGNNVGGTTLSTGSNNILIGTDSSTDAPAAATNNFLNIGNVLYGTNLQNNTNTGGAANIGIGTTTPQWLLNPYSATASQLALSAGAGIAQWTFRNAGGNFYLSTTTVSGTATSTLAALTVLNSGKVGIGTTTPTSWLQLAAGTTSVAPLGLTSGSLLTTTAAGKVEFLGDDYYATISTGAGSSYISDYPPAYSTTYVTATSIINTDHYAHFSTDPGNPLTGSWDVGNTWLSSADTNQRFHIDLGSGKVITRIYYENAHNSGGSTDKGVKDFTIWGSNNSSSFSDTTYGDDSGWTQITPASSQFAQHTGSDVADPQYITLTNSTAYRYYAFKFPNNWGGGGGFMGFRRVELQEGDNGRKQFVLNNGTNLTSGRLPYATTNGRLVDVVGFTFDGTTLTAPALTVSGASNLAGSVGIGTTTPFAKLQIATTTGKQLVLTDSGAGTNLKHWLFSSMGGNLYIGTSSDQYATSTPAAFTITNGGKVGIGTSSPTNFLSVVGSSASAVMSVQNTNINGLSSINFFNEAGLVSGRVGWGNSGGSSDAFMLRFGTDEYSKVDIFNAAVSRIRVDTNGNVGIASTSPWGLLSVNPSGITGPSFVVGSSTATQFIITNAGKVGIGTSSPMAAFTLVASSTNALRIDNAGANILTVDSTVTSSNAGIDITAGGSQTGNLLNLYSSGGTLLSFFTAAGGFQQNISSSTAVRIQDGSGNDVFMVNSTTGNIGIGTTTPSSKLSITDTTAGLHNVLAISTTTSTGGFVFTVDSYGRTFGDGAYSSPAADYAEYFYTNSTTLQSGEVVCVDV
jgi:hypothetical protein